MELTSRWTIFVFETEQDVFEYPILEKILFKQTGLTEPEAPEAWTIGTVKGILPRFNTHFIVGQIQLKQNDIKLLLDFQSYLNDPIIYAHLFITASAAVHQKTCITATYMLNLELEFN
ncbi:unnamed protein product [Rotaria sp. Silwood2]|nr:unnamed protein product [Rotaria sp. Silwood2]CAF3421473.1 unnamed protein product [Rotaria sp. Silwood2]CAF4445517.1 unnamed protein product [Rotaria sp. Silwood2]CAF4453835.1 unnamed protein product [Rotaria sp. Silwood2]CAF4502183.1 unnamed protein product [Rotaria sp. Silwood2]